MLAAVDVAPGVPVSRTALEGGRTVDMVVTPQPVAAKAAPSVLAAAAARWDAGTFTGSLVNPLGVKLTDLAGGGNDLSMVGGDVGPPVLFSFVEGLAHLWSPGWDDMWMDTPAPEGLADRGGLDIRFIGDPTARLPLIPIGFDNYLAHQGTDGDSDVSWALSFRESTYEWTLWWSVDGSEVLHVTLQGTVGLKLARRAVTADFDTGTVSLHEQRVSSPARWFNLSTSSSKWRTVDTSDAGPTAIFDSGADIRHGSSTTYEEVDGHIAYGWAALIVALEVRAGVDGDVVAGFDANDITIGPWEVVDGYPPFEGGSTTESADGVFTGVAGETWTVHNFMTKSFPITHVDRSSLLVGSRAYAETPVDDAVFDRASGESMTWAMWWRSARTDAVGQPLWSHKDGTEAHTEPGVETSVTTTIPGGVVAAPSDGTDLVVAAGPDLVPGQPNLLVVVEDGDAETVTVWSDGTPGTPVDTSAVAVGAPGLPVRFGAIVGDTDEFGSFELFSAAVFRRRLTAAEIAHLRTEMDR